MQVLELDHLLEMQCNYIREDNEENALELVKAFLKVSIITLENFITISNKTLEAISIEQDPELLIENVKNLLIDFRDASEKLKSCENLDFAHRYGSKDIGEFLLRTDINRQIAFQYLIAIVIPLALDSILDNNGFLLSTTGQGRHIKEYSYITSDILFLDLLNKNLLAMTEEMVRHQVKLQIKNTHHD